MERKLYQTILSQLNRKEYLIITGARQVGKTTILKFSIKAPYIPRNNHPLYLRGSFTDL